jgi:hypothetical protein
VTSRWPCGCHNNCAGEPALAYHGYDRFSIGNSGHRHHDASGTPATQQPTSVRSVALSDRAVASRRRLAHRRCHQHTISREATSAICAAVTRSINSTCTIRGASTPSAAKCAPTSAASHTDGKTATPPSSATARGIEILGVTTSRKTLAYMR